MTRLCKVKGFHGFVGGKDNGSVFDEGVVYECRKVYGEIILTPVGKQPDYSALGAQIENQTLSEIIEEGKYLCPNES